MGKVAKEDLLVLSNTQSVTTKSNTALLKSHSGEIYIVASKVIS
jgi:hypothetical protein